MALPVILVDSGTGSDTTCSGAGPATSLNGATNAATSSDGLTVTLPAGTDLSGVAIDGSHVIFLSDSTAGARNFGKITSSAGSGGATPTVGVANAFGLNLTSKSWAIGGRLASIGSTTSKKLFENNAGAGDALAGWTIELQSAHSETLTTSFNIHRSGDQTSGPITLRGVSGAGTLPLLTFSNNSTCLQLNSGIQYIVLKDFELKNSNGTKTASQAILATASGSSFTPNLFQRLKINTSASKFWKGIVTSGTSYTLIDSCDIGSCASNGVVLTGYALISNCYIHDNGADGITFASASAFTNLIGNIIVRNTGVGFSYTGTAGNSTCMISQNTIHANTSDGISIGGTLNPFFGLRIQNNNITGNGTGGTGYGINFPGTPAQAALDAGGTLIRNNNFGTGAGIANASGACSLSTAVADTSNVTLDPQYTDATTTNNFTVTNTSAQAIGFPTTNVGNGGTGTRSYVTPGAAQPAAGGGTYTAASNVRFGTDRGDGVTGTCYVPVAADVRYLTNVDATTGTLVLPAEDNVRVGIGFGSGGTEHSGTLAVPEAGSVIFGVPIAATTGTFVVPTEGYVQIGIGYGAGGTEFTGTLETTGMSLGDLQTELTTRGLTSGFTAGTSGGVNVLKINSTAQTARDLGASVLLSVGTGTGQVNLSSGKVPATLATTDVSGNLPANVAAWNGSNVATPDTAGYPKVTIKSGTGTGEISLSSGNLAGSVASVVGSVASVAGDVSGRVLGGGSGTITAVGTWSDIRSVNGTAVTLEAGDITTDTAQDGSTNTITLAVADTAPTDLYKGCLVRITGGTGAGQTRTITTHNGSTKVATVDWNWITPPDLTSVYAIIAADGPAVDSSLRTAASSVSSTVNATMVPTGLDAISTTAPAGVAGDFREMMVALYRRFFRKVTRTSSQIQTFADNGSTVLTTQAISDDGLGNQSQGAAS